MILLNQITLPIRPTISRFVWACVCARVKKTTRNYKFDSCCLWRTKPTCQIKKEWNDWILATFFLFRNTNNPHSFWRMEWVGYNIRRWSYVFRIKWFTGTDTFRCNGPNIRWCIFVPRKERTIVHVVNDRIICNRDAIIGTGIWKSLKQRTQFVRVNGSITRFTCGSV